MKKRFDLLHFIKILQELYLFSPFIAGMIVPLMIGGIAGNIFGSMAPTIKMYFLGFTLGSVFITSWTMFIKFIKGIYLAKNALKED